MPPTALAPSPRAIESERTERIRARLLRPMPADGWWGWVLPLLIAGVAALMRFWHLSRPGAKVFDETYYAPDSLNLLHHGVELDTNSGNTAPGFVVHPPLGKWMIAVGEQLFGNTPLGWRFSSAVVGSLAVLMIARIARRMFRSTVLGCVAGLLLAFEALEYVQSRVSMLDIFLMFWVLAAFGCLVLDRDDGRRRLAALLDRPSKFAGTGPSLGWRRWRWACGICLGAATATKWDGLFWIPAFLVLALVWDWGARRTAGCEQPGIATLRREGLGAILPFLVLPAVVYTASWTGWFVSDAAHAYGHDRYIHPGESWFSHDRNVFGAWLRYHWEIYNFHSGLDAAHPYLSRPYGWLLLARPVAYYYGTPKTCGASSCSQEVLGVGTPLIWWMVIPALIAVFWRLVSRFDWRAAAILVGFFAGYLPWFYEDAKHRTMFLFYLLPSVPFMVLAVTMVIGMVLGSVWARRTEVRRVVSLSVVGVYLIAVVANFGYLRPVLAGDVITYQQWHNRMWFTWGCSSSDNRNEHHELAPCWI